MAETEWIYDYIIQIIKSPEFRNPIKDFIDDNCNSFIGLEESTFQQSGLFNEFIMLVEQLLETALTNFGVTEEMFCLAAKKGLEIKEDAKYFEQLIAFNNYLYFKNMMTKRNLQLEEMAYQEMRTKMAMSKSVIPQQSSTITQQTNESMSKSVMNQTPQSNIKDEEIIKKMEEDELQAAIKMSMALEDEKRKLKALEEAELRKAIRFSYMQGDNKMDKTAEPFIPKEIKHNIPIAKEPISIKKEKSEKEKKDEVKPMIEESIKKEVKPRIEEPSEKDVKPKIDETTKKTLAPMAKDISSFPSLYQTRPQEKKIEAIPPQNYIDKLIEKEKAKAAKENETIDEYKYEVETKAVPLYPKFESDSSKPKIGIENLNNVIDQIETDKTNKLKEYREMILKMKKEKRQEKQEQVEDDLIGDHELSEEVRKKLELRRQLAERLKQTLK